MPLRLFQACLLLVVPLLCTAADESRPACTSQNQGLMWPDAANHDPKLISQLTRCGELLLCVRGTWHYHWESPSVRFDQLGHHAKSKASKTPVCEVDAVVEVADPDPRPLPGH